MSLENASSDDEPVVVSFIKPKRPPVPPPVVFKGGKLPAFKKRRLDDGHGSVQQQPPQPGPGAPELAPTRPKAQESDAAASNGGDDGAVSESSSGLSSPPPESERERESSSDESEREVGSAPDESDGDEVVVVERPLPPFARRFPKPPPAVLPDQEPGQAAKATATATARVAKSIPEPPVTSKQGQAPAAPSALPSAAAVDPSPACAAEPMLKQLGLSEPIRVAPFETTLTITSTKTNGQLSAVPATAKALAAPTVEASSATVVQFDANRPRRRGARYAADLALAELKAARAKRAVAAGAAATAATPRSPSPPRPPPIEVRPYVKPPDAPSGKLPSELLAMLVVAGAPLASGAAEPPDDVRETIIPLLRGLLDGVKPALARLRAWDAGWEDMIIQRRIELAKSRFIRGPCVLGVGEAVEWPGREVYDRPWENTLCLWHIHSTIVLGLPSTKPAWTLIDRYTALNPIDVLSPGADPATERGAELVRQRWAAKGRLREIALGWLAAAEAYKEPYRFQHAAYLDLLRSHLLVLPPERDRPPSSDDSLPHAVVLGPPPSWTALRTALVDWATEAAALVGELDEIDADVDRRKRALQGWS